MEATVVCVDNSESTRNGDFEPNRFQAQVEAINLLAGAKTGANPENTVGILTCATVAGKAPKVMVTPTPNLGKVLEAMAGIGLEGAVDLCKSAQIAQLALKHRQNKRQAQRVVIFVGSTLQEEKARVHL
jgi:26S proteasome regulatory subunit N10